MKQHYYFTCTVNMCWFEAAFILFLNNEKRTKNGQLLVKPNNFFLRNAEAWFKLEKHLEPRASTTFRMFL